MDIRIKIIFYATRINYSTRLAKNLKNKLKEKKSDFQKVEPTSIYNN